MFAALLVVWAAWITWSDWQRRRVPNVALAVVLAPELLALLIQGQGLLGQQWVSSFGGTAIGIVLSLPGYIAGRLGAGDVKLAAVLGLLLGLSKGVELMLLSSLLMGICALVLLILRTPRRARFPAAPMLATAFIVEMVCGPLILA